MQTEIQKEKKETINNESLILTNRNSLKLEGIVEVIATSDTNIILKLINTPLHITGSNISITRLDIEKGILEANGNFEAIKYTKSGGFLRKILK